VHFIHVIILFAVIINGDLIDSEKSKKPTYLDSLKMAKLLLTITQNNNGRAIIIPGDRDWASSSKKGWDSVKKLEKLIQSMNLKNVHWAIKDGCPGPEMIELNEHLILVTVNTQWWNHPYSKPEPTTAKCKISTERDFLIELENIIEDTENKNILVAGHFPLESLGEYGGSFSVGKYLFPPIYGSLNVGFRQNVGSSMDITNERFDPIRGKIKNTLFRKGSVIYAGGHEHNLQILHHANSFMISSGAPESANYVEKNKKASLFAESMPGIVELVYFNTGQVDYRIHQYQKDNIYSLYTEQTLLTSPCQSNSNAKNLNT